MFERQMVDGACVYLNTHIVDDGQDRHPPVVLGKKGDAVFIKQIFTHTRTVSVAPSAKSLFTYCVSFDKLSVTPPEL